VRRRCKSGYFSVFHSMIFFLVLGLWPSFWVIRRRRPFPFLPKLFARCKESWNRARFRAANHFGAREPKILSTRRSPGFNWP